MKKLIAATLPGLMAMAMSVTAFAEGEAATGFFTQERLIGGACVIVIFAALGYKEMLARKNKAKAD